MEKIYGRHAVNAVFITRPQDIKQVYVLDGSKPQLNHEYLAMAKTAGITPTLLSYKAFLQQTQLTDSDNHQGICIFTTPRTINSEKEVTLLENTPLVLALDQVANPRNLATIIRSSAFFGLEALLLLKNRPADITPEVIQMAVGGTEFIKIFKITNLVRSLKKLKELGFWIYGLDDSGKENIFNTTFSKKAAFVVGAEGQGLRQQTKKFCDFFVKIPGGQDGIECLNASVAASIALATYFGKKAC